MKGPKFFFWQENRMFIGHLEDYPDYWAQGETIKELEENLIDIYRDILNEDLIHKLKALGCVLIRQGESHDWYQNPDTKVSQPVPRHVEVKETLAKHITKMLK